MVGMQSLSKKAATAIQDAQSDKSPGCSLRVHRQPLCQGNCSTEERGENRNVKPQRWEGNFQARFSKMGKRNGNQESPGLAQPAGLMEEPSRAGLHML